MNGKYYGKREIRWHSREKERLEHIQRKIIIRCKRMAMDDEESNQELQQSQSVGETLERT
jgi:hypothetical protein